MSLSAATTSALLDNVKALWPASSATGTSTPTASAQLANLANPYAIVAGVVLTGANRPELIPEVWKHATAGLDDTDKTLITRRLRDAIFKGGVLTGYSRAINSLIELNGALPENLRASNFGSERGLDWPKGSSAAVPGQTTGVTSSTGTAIRSSATDILLPPASLGDVVADSSLVVLDASAPASSGATSVTETSLGTTATDVILPPASVGDSVSGATSSVTTAAAGPAPFLVPGHPQPTLDEVAEHGRKYFFELYGDTAVPVQNTLDSIHPDMGFFSSTLAYGLVYGGAWHLVNMPETSFVLVAALVAVDTPRQVGWHLANTRRLGVPLAEARAVREMAIQVARAAGVTWREPVPEVPEM